MCSCQASVINYKVAPDTKVVDIDLRVLVRLESVVVDNCEPYVPCADTPVFPGESLTCSVDVIGGIAIPVRVLLSIQVPVPLHNVLVPRNAVRVIRGTTGPRFRSIVRRSLEGATATDMTVIAQQAALDFERKIAESDRDEDSEEE